MRIVDPAKLVALRLTAKWVGDGIVWLCMRTDIFGFLFDRV